MPPPADAAAQSNSRNAVLAGFLGWTFDAFDFFILTFVLPPVAKEFHRSIPDIALAITASLATRPIGAFLFGLMADRYGRRIPLMLDIVFYSVVEFASGLAPSYRHIFRAAPALRHRHGRRMGSGRIAGHGIGSRKWRGILSGLLQEGYALGYLLAAVAYWEVFPHWGWRADVFHWRRARAADALHTRQGKKAGSVAALAAKTDWSSYVRAIFANSQRFVYLVLLMAMMNFISHGTQDMYPTFFSNSADFCRDNYGFRHASSR